GLVDWVFAAQLITREEGGTVRELGSGWNDWYWAPGNGRGWDPPRPWVMPAKSGSALPWPAVKVHGTPFLGISVSDTELKPVPLWGVGVGASVGLTGYGLNASVVTPGGAVGIPVGWGGSWGGTSGFSVAPIETWAMNTAMAQIEAMANHSRAVGAAARSIASAAASNDPVANAMPSFGVNLAATTQGASFSLRLPLLGDLLIKF